MGNPNTRKGLSCNLCNLYDVSTEVLVTLFYNIKTFIKPHVYLLTNTHKNEIDYISIRNRCLVIVVNFAHSKNIIKFQRL